MAIFSATQIKEIERMIAKKLEPIVEDIREVKVTAAAVKEETSQQTTKIVKIDAWKNELYGNGSGKEGFLDKARREDKQRLDRMEQNQETVIAAVDNLKTRIDKDDAVSVAVKEALVEVNKKRENKLQWAIGILGVIAAGGGFGWLFHVLDKVSH